MHATAQQTSTVVRFGRSSSRQFFVSLVGGNYARLMPLPMTVKKLAEQVNTWGKWGEDDQLGTLNYLTDEAVMRGIASARSGKRFSLAVDLQLDGMQLGAIPGRLNPLRTMVAINSAMTPDDPESFHTSDDVVTMGLQAATHWDALAHVSYSGSLYNGQPAEAINEWGASACGISNVKTLTGRGVLLDVAAALGVDQLDFGYAITAEDLDAAVAHGSLSIASGDIVLIRTGLMAKYFAGDKQAYNGWSGSPGPGLSCVEWFHRHEIAAAATDTLVFEVFPPEHDDAMLAVHMLDLVDLGLTQGQNWNLEELAVDCAADGQYDFLLEASPLPFVGGCGSPVNPVAVK